MASESASAATKSKSSKDVKTSSVKIPPAHPTYLQMSAEAISSLKERTGSSTYAIAKWLEQKYNGLLPANFKNQLHLQLKKQTQKGKLIRIKNSYKLSDELKKSVKKIVNLKSDLKKSCTNAVTSKKTSRTTNIPNKIRSVEKLATKGLKSKCTVKMSSNSKVADLSKKPAIKSLSSFSKPSTEPTGKKVQKHKVSTKSATKVGKSIPKDSISKVIKIPTKLDPANQTYTKRDTYIKINKPAPVRMKPVTKPASNTKKKPVAKQIVISKPDLKKSRHVEVA